MRGYSLRLRLLLGTALWVGVALLATGIALVVLFVSHVELDLQVELEASLERVAAVIDPDAPDQQLHEPLSDPRYDTPFGGLYWQVDDLTSGTAQRSRSLWDTEIDVPEAKPGGLFTMGGPDGQALAAVSRVVSFDVADGRRSYRVTVAQDRAFTDQSISSFRIEMSVALLVVGAILLLAGWLQIELGLRPVRRLARGVEAIRTGAASELDGDYPTEVTPLVGELNELIAERERSLDRARAQAADLAHGLRTPLSIVTATADRLRRRGDDEDASVLDDVAKEMTVRTDYQLRLARLRPRTAAQALSASLNGALLRTVSVLRKTGGGERLFWRVDLATDCAVDIDRYDLLELVGNLIENAVKWTRTRIDITSACSEGHAEVRIGDDGPGMTEDQIAVIGRRGVRLDESRPGSGFGLAIAFEIVALNRASLVLGRSEHGGVGVTLRLALSATPAPAP